MTKKEAKQKRIDDILEAAVDVFTEKGYENASMNDIAEKAGISKGGLYHHFLSKDMVLLYANQKLLEPCLEMLEEANRVASAAAGLKSYIYGYLKYWNERKKELVFFSLSMTKAMTHRDIFKMYERFTEDYISSMEDFFKRGMKNGEFAAHDSRARAIALISAMDGVLVYMVLDKKLSLKDIARYFEEIFIIPVLTDK